MTAYYNEIDPFAAQWLRELIAAGLIAPGEVDERSIEDVRPDDLVGYTQCHFFAGIGVWSYALRRAGWPDDAPVWTGSCPCQPFSSAGKRGGFDDERHLWPAFHWLIQQCAPPVVLGEQVASKPTGPWFDLVQADVEALGYAFGCVPFPSAGVGAPHIRDRAYWVANASSAGLPERVGERRIQREAVGACEGEAAVGGGHLGVVGNTQGERCGEARTAGPGHPERAADAGSAGSVIGRVGHPDGAPERGGFGEESGETGGAQREAQGKNGQWHGPVHAGNGTTTPWPAAADGFWGSADWLFSRDGKLRPVEPGTFPLVDGLTKGMVPSSRQGMAIDANKTAEARVMRLKGYGNAINAEAATAFVQAVMEVV